MARPVNDILKWESVWVLFQQKQCNKEYVYFLSSVVDSRSTHKYEIDITLTLFWVWSHVSSLKQIPAWMNFHIPSKNKISSQWALSSNKGGINKHALTCNILTMCRFWLVVFLKLHYMMHYSQLRRTKTLFADTDTVYYLLLYLCNIVVLLLVKWTCWMIKDMDPKG